MSAALLRELLLATLLATAVKLLLDGLRPFTRRFFSRRWQYYSQCIPLFFFAGGGRLAAWIGRGLCAAWPSGFDGTANTSGGLPVPPFAPLVIPPPSVPEQPLIWESAAAPAEYAWIGVALWLGGALLFFLTALFRYRTFACRLRRQSRPILLPGQRVRARSSPAITSPLLIGVCRPVLYLPDTPMTAAERQLAIAHERMHLHHGDLWLKLLALVLNAVHWFNPFAYRVSRDIEELCELACDERLTADMSFDERRQYCETILNRLERRAGSLARLHVGFSTAKRGLERRLQTIMFGKKTKISLIVLSLAVAMVITGVGGAAAYTADVIVPQPETVVSPTPTSPTEETTTQTSATLSTTSAAPTTTGSATETTAAEPPQTTAGEWATQPPLHSKKILTRDFGGAPGTLANDGMDFTAPNISGTAVYAVGDGTVQVAESGWTKEQGIEGNKRYGRYVVIDHSNGYQSVYACCEELFVKVGDTVKAGQAIATVGTTGGSTGPHLHFELRKNGVAVDPKEHVPMPQLYTSLPPKW